MPFLPFDHPEPLAATLGVMLYPGTDGTDPANARAFAAQHLAKAHRQLREAGVRLHEELLIRLFEDCGERMPDLEERWRGGVATGELLKTLFALAETERDASWSKAVQQVQVQIVRNKFSGSRTSLWEMKGQFISVAHLWAAYCIRGRRFKEQPEAGYGYRDDFWSFITEAEVLRRWGRKWRAHRAKATPPLPEDMWTAPDDWEPPIRNLKWPTTGKVPVMTLPVEALQGFRSAGRPRAQR